MVRASERALVLELERALVQALAPGLELEQALVPVSHKPPPCHPLAPPP